jgi:hypothetical protein
MGKILCTNCNTILTSTHRHDFVSCNCSNGTFVDGGSDYLRCGGKDLRFIEVIEEGKLDNPK